MHSFYLSIDAWRIGVGGSGSSLVPEDPTHDGDAVMNGAPAFGLAVWEVVLGQHCSCSSNLPGPCTLMLLSYVYNPA